jgi:hypothetical protein
VRYLFILKRLRIKEWYDGLTLYQFWAFVESRALIDHWEAEIAELTRRSLPGIVSPRIFFSGVYASFHAGKWTDHIILLLHYYVLAVHENCFQLRPEDFIPNAVIYLAASVFSWSCARGPIFK